MRKVSFLLLFLFWAACRPAEDPSTQAYLTYQAQRYEGRLLNEWVALALKTIREQELSTPEAARVLGYVGMTAWEAICPGLPNGRSLSGQIRDYQSPDIATNKVYDWGIVLCSAMRTVLPEVFEQLSNSQIAALETLAAVQEDTLFKRGLTERIRQDSRFLGGRIGATIAERARNDGRRAIRQLVPALPRRDAEHPQYWTPTPPEQQAVEPLWSQVKTFVWEQGAFCSPPAPPSYSAIPGSSWYLQAQEVANVPQNTANRLAAFHWEDGPRHSSTAAGHWFNIARQLLEREGSNLAECARIYCLLGLTISDACALVWAAKYQYFLLRPITYIHEHLDPSWQPLLFTPAHPEYPNENAVLASACSTLLTSELSDSGFVDRTHLGSLLYTPAGGPFVLPERTFGSITQAGQEAAFAGLLGGIHFRRSCEEGQKAGICLAQQVLMRVQFVR